MDAEEVDEYEEETMSYLVDTGVENAEAFCNVFERHGRDVKQFLHRETYIPVRSTTMGEQEQNDLLFYQHDIDGIVIEWKTLEGIGFQVPYMNIIRNGVMSVQPVYSLLKKHFDLRRFSVQGLSVFKRCVGTKLCYNDGWETWVGFIPEYELHEELTYVDFKSMAVKALTNLRILFQRSLKEQIGKCTVDNTLAKNNLNNLSYVRIVPHEQIKILALLQLSLDDLDVAVAGIRKVAFSFRFGDKYPHTVKLPIRSNGSVECVSIHAGLTLHACYTTEENEDIEINMFWSRTGLQEIVGHRGSLISAFSFMECANFQSNLDGRLMDISGDLRRVSIYPDNLRFVQLYADIPHRRPKVRFHPVSGAVCLMSGVSRNSASLYADAECYLSEISNNFEQLSVSRCRLEMVVALPDNCTIIQPSSLLQIREMSALIHRHAVLVPFLNPSFTDILRDVGLSLVDQMKKDYAASRGTGKGNVVWRTYQSELAVEKILWGHPFCTASNLFSVNLGPGLAYPTRSETDMMGFLTLCESTTCCSDEYCSPPVSIYSRSEIMQKQTRKTFGFMDLIGGSNIAIGRRLVYILLQDLHETGAVYESFESFYLSLKVGNASGNYRIVGGTTLKQLAELIGKARKGKYPMVVGHLLQLLEANSVDVASVLQAGFQELELGKFPALRLFDEHRHQGLSWKWTYGLLLLTDIPEFNKCVEMKSILMTSLVIREMENRKLCYSSSLGNVTLPWIRPCIQKLNELQLSNEQLVIVLTFVSCIARLMDGAYVDYNRLDRLRTDLPRSVTQRLLQSMEIQSKFLLNSYNLGRIWRLHHSLPFKALNAAKVKPSTESVQKKPDAKSSPFSDDNEALRIPSEVEENVTGNIKQHTAEVRHIPSNSWTKWSSTELGILADIKEKHSRLSFRSKYEIYQNECRALGIPDRSQGSVRKKMLRS